MNMFNQTILALDYGKKRVGCALKHKNSVVIFPWGVTQNDSSLLEHIAQVVRDEQVGIIVVGMPFNKQGRDDNRSAEAARALGASLQECTPCVIAYIDERFTTVEARQEVVASGASVDERAAQLILETYVQRSQK